MMGHATLLPPSIELAVGESVILSVDANTLYYRAYTMLQGVIFSPSLSFYSLFAYFIFIFYFTNTCAPLVRKQQ